MISRSQFLIPLSILILFLSCKSRPVEEIVEPVSGLTYYSETKELLLEQTDTRFWKAINFYSDEFPEETGRLLLEYSLFQKELIRHYIDSEDPYTAQFHLNNLCSIEEVDGSFFPKETLQKEISVLLEKKNKEGRSHLFSQGNAAASDILSITDFNHSLAEIHVKYNWENEDGIERFNKDDMAGSGFLITPSHVLTAFHVVSNVFENEITKYQISLHFGDIIINDVKILAWDSLTDLAVLEIPEPVNLPFLYNLFSDLDETRQGDVVYALGHPYGYVNTLSKGIVSSARRKAPEWGSWIQIDASVGPGSSGGLLLNEQGKIAGLVVAGINGEEMNFAVPSSLIKKVIDPMINGITIKRPWCGLLFDDDEKSLVIHHIFEESPLAAAGLKKGDSLTAVNNISIDSLETAKNMLDTLEAGNIVSLDFSSGNRDRTFWIKMMRRPDYAIVNKIERMDIPERVLVSTGVEIIETSDSLEEVPLGQNTYIFQSYAVKEIDKTSYLYSQGVRKGDKLGLIEDYFKNRKYYLTVLHIPGYLKVSELIDPRDLVFTIIKDKYNEFIF